MGKIKKIFQGTISDILIRFARIRHIVYPPYTISRLPKDPMLNIWTCMKINCSTKNIKKTLECHDSYVCGINTNVFSLGHIYFSRD